MRGHISPALRRALDNPKTRYRIISAYLYLKRREDIAASRSAKPRERTQADFEATELSLERIVAKNDERLRQAIGSRVAASREAAKIKPPPDSSWPGFGALSKAAVQTLASVFESAVRGRRDADRE